MSLLLNFVACHAVFHCHPSFITIWKAHLWQGSTTLYILYAITWNPPSTTCLLRSWLCWVIRKERDLCMWPFKCSFANQNCEPTGLRFFLCSLWNNAVPPPPRPVHLPLPADVIPGCGHVLHRPPAPTASVRGAGGRSGCLPAAYETASVGLLDMADHAVTETDHRRRHGAFFLFFSDPVFFPISEGARAYKHLSHLARLCTLSVVLNHSH